MALPAAAKAAKIASEAWNRRETIGPLLLVPLVLVGAMISVPTMFLSFATSTAGQAEQVCIDTRTPPSDADADAVRRAARRRGAEAPAAAVLAALSSKAKETYPTDTLANAGEYRLGVDYAAGDPTDPGRWAGPTDPAGPDAMKDSRRSINAATRAVMRTFTRTDAPVWRELRTAPTTTDPGEVEHLMILANSLLVRAFPELDVDQDTLTEAILAAAVVDSGGYGDQVTGGVLTIGDPELVATTRELIGGRAFGGQVTARATSANPGQITTGADRRLSAQEGVVIAIADTTPTPEQMEDVQDSTNADVVWVVPGVTADGIYPSVDGAIAALSSLAGATAPVSLCQQVLVTTDTPVDLSAIVAPDGGAFSAIAYAQSMVGLPYSNSARPPESWDCSKLTAAAWKAAGVSLTAYSYSQWDQTQRIPASMVQPGDIAFWFGTDGASGGHVALVDQVLPDGTVWITEAANPTDGVRRRALGGSWDDAYFTGFGRVKRPHAPTLAAAPTDLARKGTVT